MDLEIVFVFVVENGVRVFVNEKSVFVFVVENGVSVFVKEKRVFV